MTDPGGWTDADRQRYREIEEQFRVFRAEEARRARERMLRRWEPTTRGRLARWLERRREARKPQTT